MLKKSKKTQNTYSEYSEYRDFLYLKYDGPIPLWEIRELEKLKKKEIMSYYHQKPPNSNLYLFIGVIVLAILIISI